MSPANLLLLKLIETLVFPSYGLFVAVALTVKLLAVIDPVAVTVVLVKV